jgi:hypothetical protein
MPITPSGTSFRRSRASLHRDALHQCAFQGTPHQSRLQSRRLPRFARNATPVGARIPGTPSRPGSPEMRRYGPEHCTRRNASFTRSFLQRLRRVPTVSLLISASLCSMNSINSINSTNSMNPTNSPCLYQSLRVSRLYELYELPLSPVSWGGSSGLRLFEQ